MSCKPSAGDKPGSPNPVLHFVLTLMTLGLWAPVWCYLIQRAQGRTFSLFHIFDRDYWSYLIEREQPPASLYSLQVQHSHESKTYFDA
ncbi:MAG: hypothetical protein LPD71_09240 [Shewanella sp.]|nr:hypothetical protein [Shewanella sp.]MCF1430677.1 hypothetical protein [Shewanella sp.]MCF1438910.1 hypothetical protein [Shewanella sp.]MCF1457265.1 hypothetical protein [Shewanella sp.]